MYLTKLSNLVVVTAILCAGCRPHMSPTPQSLLDSSQQLVVVTTPDWDATVGKLFRFERATPASDWKQTEYRSVPVVVGRTGIAWGVGFDSEGSDGPHKHEGDGKAPAGIFPLDTVFGFAPADSAKSVRMPYVQLVAGSDCVDDTTSAHYNTVVDRESIPVDWNSAEHMRQVAQYKIGVIVGYNAAPPVKGRGSCIFLHIWNGPDSHTAGCTAMEEQQLQAIIDWLDARRHPLMVQMTEADYERERARLNLPLLMADAPVRLRGHPGG